MLAEFLVIVWNISSLIASCKDMKIHEKHSLYILQYALASREHEKKFLVYIMYRCLAY